MRGDFRVAFAIYRLKRKVLIIDRTYVYIDGFNLYHGAVKNRPEFKWLDLVSISRRLMAGSQVLKVKYFTAKVRKLDDPARPARQLVYWRALRRLYPTELEIIEGHFRIDPKRLRIAKKGLDGKYKATSRSIMVMKPEEKGTDVNLAVHLLNYARLNHYDTALIISNDSDLFEAIRIVKNDLFKRVVLANPFLWTKTGVARELLSLGLYKRKITEKQLAACQLPESIPNTNIVKPLSWK